MHVTKRLNIHLVSRARNGKILSISCVALTHVHTVNQSIIECSGDMVTTNRNDEIICDCSKHSGNIGHLSAPTETTISIYSFQKSIIFIMSGKLFDCIVGIFPVQSKYRHWIWKFDKYVHHIHWNLHFLSLIYFTIGIYRGIDRKIQWILSKNCNELQLSIAISRFRLTYL